jgi:hypothetical protein
MKSVKLRKTYAIGLCFIITVVLCVSENPYAEGADLSQSTLGTAIDASGVTALAQETAGIVKKREALVALLTHEVSECVNDYMQDKVPGNIKQDVRLLKLRELDRDVYKGIVKFCVNKKKRLRAENLRKISGKPDTLIHEMIRIVVWGIASVLKLSPLSYDRLRNIVYTFLRSVKRFEIREWLALNQLASEYLIKYSLYGIAQDWWGGDIRFADITRKELNIGQERAEIRYFRPIHKDIPVLGQCPDTFIGILLNVPVFNRISCKQGFIVACTLFDAVVCHEFQHRNDIDCDRILMVRDVLDEEIVDQVTLGTLFIEYYARLAPFIYLEDPLNYLLERIRLLKQDDKPSSSSVLDKEILYKFAESLARDNDEEMTEFVSEFREGEEYFGKLSEYLLEKIKTEEQVRSLAKDLFRSGISVEDLEKYYIYSWMGAAGRTKEKAKWIYIESKIQRIIFNKYMKSNRRSYEFNNSYIEEYMKNREIYNPFYEQCCIASA